MNAKATDEFMTENRTRYGEAMKALIPLAKAAVNVLKDANQPTTARELEAQLFAIETIEQELVDALRKDPQAFFEATMARIRPKP